MLLRNVRGPRNGLKIINNTKDKRSTSRHQKGDGSWSFMPTQMNQRWGHWKVGRIKECSIIGRGVTQVNEQWIVTWTMQQRFISKDG